MEKFKVAIVGVGGIARAVHLPALKDNKKVEVIASCDIIASRCDDADALLGYKTRHYTDYKKMLETEKIDALHICLPNYLHSKVAVEALNLGINVFCEKPDAVSVEEAMKMQDAENKSGKLLMVMRNNRHLTCSKLAKDYIDKGEVGDIYCGRCGWIRRRGIPGKGGWFTTKSMSGGGPLIDLGVHMIDLSVYLMGNPKVVSVSGCVYNKFANSADISDSVHSSFGEAKADGIFDVEDLAMGFLKFDNGACLQIEFSWASNVEEEKNFVELRGTKAGIKIENSELKIFTERAGELLNINKVSSAVSGHGANINHFYEVLSKNAKPDYNISQGINIIKILEGIYESARTGREIVL